MHIVSHVNFSKFFHHFSLRIHNSKSYWRQIILHRLSLTAAFIRSCFFFLPSFISYIFIKIQSKGNKLTPGTRHKKWVSTKTVNLMCRHSLLFRKGNNKRYYMCLWIWKRYLPYKRPRSTYTLHTLQRCIRLYRNGVLTFELEFFILSW